VEADPKRRLGAMIAGGALSYSVARAVLEGLIFKNAPFRRTPKARPAPKLIMCLRAVRMESAFLAALCAAGAVLIATQDVSRLDVQLWFGVIAMQAWPFAAALILSIRASKQVPAEWAEEDEAIPLAGEFREAAE